MTVNLISIDRKHILKKCYGEVKTIVMIVYEYLAREFIKNSIGGVLNSYL